ncbi:hypothetical protein TRFO_15049 [Tritrichomonas foetus]|uniref:Uncharacterized protein n=1 Tax=Tritrichomonas foetus TaxID=1144522 RepID=A0A1J4KTR8_9EUKA|nr:hypothetical protein TRFO_15049 [Tritrichomonas foetus]|eukprot:OHT14530.1 hypothetical protein TRFO_15049 [Tritrichomonas foetus]
MTFFAFARGRKDPPPPDPGKYDIPSTFGQGPKITFHTRHKEFKREYNPDYYPLPSTLSKKGCTIGTKFKTRESLPASPGPSYNASTIGQGRKSSLHVRHYEPKNDTPGPGQYNVDSGKILNVTKYANSPSYTCGVGKRFDFIQDNTLVAPGSYNLPSTLELSRPMTIGTHPHQPFRKKAHPGPIYDTGSQLGKDQPSFSFPKAPRDMPIKQSPGPADYQKVESFAGSNRSKIPPKMRSRTALPQPENNSAPFYDIQTTIVPQKKSIGTRPPTSYETMSPGPVYTLPPTLEKREAHIRIKTEMKDPKLDVPSPDSYWMAPITPMPPPIVGMTGPDDRSIIDTKKEREKPGPADYRDKTRTIEPGRKGFTFSSRIVDEVRPDTAAPYHSTSSTLGGPMFTIGLRDA